MHTALSLSEAVGRDEEEMLAIRASKKALRSSVAQIIRGLAIGEVNRQSLAVVERLLSTKEYQTARRISVYLSMKGTEIETPLIVKHALQTGKTVFVPYIHKVTVNDKKDSLMSMLALESMADHDALELDSWGIPTISKSSVASRENCFGDRGVEEAVDVDGAGLDLIVVPGMAFDRKLGRLGHGKGYYDKFLSLYKQKMDRGLLGEKMPFLAGLALNEQVLEQGREVPASSHDWRLDRVYFSNGAV